MAFGSYTLTNIVVILTVLLSILAFTSDRLFDKMLFNAYRIWHKKEWYRLITHGFIHGGWVHLIVNMIVLFSFGRAVEHFFGYKLEHKILHFFLLYLGGIVISSLLSLKKYKDDIHYNAVGASGGVSAVLFCTIFFAPWQPIYLYGIIEISGIIFGAIYLAYSQFMSIKKYDNVNHQAHFTGAIFGFIYPIIMNPALFTDFLYHLKQGL